jgi:hypothetical protein
MQTLTLNANRNRVKWSRKLRRFAITMGKSWMPGTRSARSVRKSQEFQHHNDLQSKVFLWRQSKANAERKGVKFTDPQPQ